MTRTPSKKNRAPKQSRARKTFPLSYVGLGPEQARAALLEALPDAFLCLDTQWQLTYLNHRAEVLLGAMREALLGKNVWEALVLSANSELSRNFHEALEKQRSLEYSLYFTLLLLQKDYTCLVQAPKVHRPLSLHYQG